MYTRSPVYVRQWMSDYVCGWCVYPSFHLSVPVKCCTLRILSHRAICIRRWFGAGNVTPPTQTRPGCQDSAHRLAPSKNVEKASFRTRRGKRRVCCSSKCHLLVLQQDDTIQIAEAISPATEMGRELGGGGERPMVDGKNLHGLLVGQWR